MQEFPEFDYSQVLAEDAGAVMFTGEHVFSWMAIDFVEFSGWGDVVNAVAEFDDWGVLYGDNSEPIQGAAAVYYNDMYVDRDISMAVVEGSLKGVKTWVTSDYEHSGLRDGGSAVFERIDELARD